MSAKNYVIMKAIKWIEIIFWPLVKTILPSAILVMWHLHVVFGSDASTSLLDSFRAQKLKFYSVLMGTCFTVKKGKDLILLSIKRHCMNCFAFFFVQGLKQRLVLISNLLFGETDTREEIPIDGSTREKLMIFVFMQNHRIVQFVFWLKTYCIWNCNGVLIFMYTIHSRDSKWIESTEMKPFDRCKAISEEEASENQWRSFLIKQIY